MRRAIAPALLAALLGLACAAAGPEPQAEPGRLRLPATDDGAGRPESVVLISVAGLTSDRYRAGAGMPALAALARSGAAADAVHSVAPASSYPAHATLVSGQPPSRHGIAADRLLGDGGVRASSYWHASHLRAPTLWQLATQSQRRVAALAWPTTLGAEVAELVPDIVPTRRGETWLSLLAGATIPPGLLERVRAAGGEAPEAAYPGPARDAVLARVACELLSGPAPPALLLLHLSQTRPALAARGPDSPEAAEAFRGADRSLAGILRCLDAAGRLAASAVVVVGDHGVLPLHTLVQPNAVLAREGLLRARPGGGSEVERWSAIARSNGGSAFVYARDEESALRARRLLAEEAARSRAFRIVSAKEMLEIGADPGAWFGLEANPGYAFGNATGGLLLAPANARGAGGYLPGRAGMDAGFVAWGRGIRGGVRIPEMRQSDVAPTLALLMGLDLGDVEGRPLVGALIWEVVAGAGARAR